MSSEIACVPCFMNYIVQSHISCTFIPIKIVLSGNDIRTLSGKQALALPAAESALSNLPIQICIRVSLLGSEPMFGLLPQKSNNSYNCLVR